MTGTERYHLVAPLPPLGGWRRMLALDRRGGQPGPVVLSFAPVALVEDAAQLAALSRDAEAGARVHHANVLTVLGLEAVDDQLALVEPYRAGTPLRALLDASGRLPAELAVRIACDAAAGLAALHGLAVGDGQPLAHGALTAERILVAEDGTSLVAGVGTGAGRSAAADVRALAAVLQEMLTGEPVRAGAKLEIPGAPEALAAVVEGAREDAFPGAAAFAEALVKAFAPAAGAAVAVYVGAVTPAPQAAMPPIIPAVAPAAVVPAPVPVPVVPARPPGERGAQAAAPAAAAPRSAPAPTADAPEVSAELISPGRVPEVSAELLAPGRVPEVSAELLAPAPRAPERPAGGLAPGRLAARAPAPEKEPTPERTPPPDAAITFPAPAAVAAGRRLPRAPILAAVAIAGLALGFGIARFAFGPPRGPAVAVPGPSAEASPPPLAAVPPPAPAEPAPPGGAPARPQAIPWSAVEARAETRPDKPPAADARAAPARKPPSISVTATPVGDVLVDGKTVGRAPLVVEVTAGEHEVRLRDRTQGVDVRQRVRVKGPVTPVRFQLARGKLEVTAPGDTEVYVDGRRIGLGSQTVALWEGWHEVEARRGSSRVKERFQLTAVVTVWTYNVTPAD